MEQNLDFKKTFLITVIISLSISALIGIFVFLFGDFGEIEIKLLWTTITIGGYSLTGLCCSALYEKRKFAHLALSGMVISVIGILFTALLIWEAIDLEDSWKALTTVIVLAFSIAHLCLLLLIKSENPLVNRTRSATMIFISIVALMLLIIILFELYDVDEFYYRLLGIFAILDVLGTIVTPILNKIYSIQQ